jgi:hypothetical protein
MTLSAIGVAIQSQTCARGRTQAPRRPSQLALGYPIAKRFNINRARFDIDQAWRVAKAALQRRQGLFQPPIYTARQGGLAI